MKKIALLIAGGALLGTANAQTAKKPAVKPTPAASAPVLKTLADSASYALAYKIANSLKQDMGGFNPTIIANTFKAAMEGKPSIFSDEKAYEIFMAYTKREKEKDAAAAIKSGEDFLAKNKLRPGVKTTASGLQYEIIKEGSGTKPAATDTAVCHYIGKLADGTEFDNSYTRGEPLSIPVNGVIKGWTEGLQLMSKGATYKFYIPYQLGYGLRGAPPTIPPGATLVFDVTLVDVKK